MQKKKTFSCVKIKMAFMRSMFSLRTRSIKVTLLCQNVNYNVRSIFATPVSWTTIHSPKNQSTASAQTKKAGRRDVLDTSFNDPYAAFKSKTTYELIRAYFVYMLCSSEYLVENNMKVRKKSMENFPLVPSFFSLMI